MITDLDIPFSDTSADQLSLSLTTPRLPHVARSAVLAGELTIELRILRASHQVVLDAPAGTLIETVACLERGSLPTDLSSTPHPGVGFDFTARVAQYDDADFATAVDALIATAESDDHALIGRFPGHHLALTGVQITSLAPVAWRSWHTYPQTGQIVSTYTSITLREAALPLGSLA
ncbi:DUF2617 family protein [Epidermidibacterium keratini]|uniref:DUF2617 family protein n=1 Tax=Epidermidibacterium keratini TaxID=1891644 RepID=A0A7L4YPI3_9ACTN|nr:DUF2617 family protein [Epidermidibacterium keratini]QHC01191.1 DUF2617 family protein [Epidermidibacterium keratini]